jgi:hypothetical protein
LKSDEQLIEELERAAAGLMFMSESEYPFETVYWKGLPEVSAQHLRGLSGLGEDAPVATLSIDEFFGTATSDEAWRAEEGRLAARRYRELVAALKENLKEMKVYRVGEVNIPVYIVGRAESGNWLGVSTRVVET